MSVSHLSSVDESWGYGLSPSGAGSSLVGSKSALDTERMDTSNNTIGFYDGSDGGAFDLGLIEGVAVCGETGRDLSGEMKGYDLPSGVDVERLRCVLRGIVHPDDELIYRDRRKAPLENIVYVPSHLWTIATGLAQVQGPVKTGFFSSISATDNERGSGLGVIAWPDRVSASLEDVRSSIPNIDPSMVFQRLAAFGSVNVSLNDQDPGLIMKHHREQITILKHWWARFRPSVMSGMKTFGFKESEKITFGYAPLVEMVLRNKILGPDDISRYEKLAEAAGGNPEDAISYLAYHLGTPLTGAMSKSNEFKYQRIIFSGGSDRDFLRDHFRVLQHLGYLSSPDHGYAGLVTSSGPEGPAYNRPRKGELSLREAVMGDFSGPAGLRALKKSLKCQRGTRWMAVVAAKKESEIPKHQQCSPEFFDAGVRIVRDFLSDEKLKSDFLNI